jgi:hypothetical protein
MTRPSPYPLRLEGEPVSDTDTSDVAGPRPAPGLS